MSASFTIVGGGTAGCIAALFINKKYPDVDVTLIRSREIGILGAGEGTTPHLISMLEHDLHITPYELYKNTSSTMKLGIQFENWNKAKGGYFHGFGNGDGTSYLQNGTFFQKLAYNNRHYDEFSLANLLTKQKKSPFIETSSFKLLNSDDVERSNINVMKDLGEQTVNYAIHFNAVELASYLEKVAVERGVHLIEDKVVDIVLDDNEYITELKLENNNSHKTDFVIDSTGFGRLILGKKYNTEWISRKEYLPMKEAQPFFLPQDNIDNVEPCTDAIAQDAGWIWKIPLQNRYGCGYVYDSDYITNEQVKEKILELYPTAEMGKKTFKFEAGYYNNTVVKNCFGAGLASSFVEPLEATSIYAFVEQLQFANSKGLFKIFKEKNNIEEFESIIKAVSNNVNSYCRSTNEDVCEFIQFHYITDRDDTPFWREFRSKNKLFDNVKARVGMLSNGFVDTNITQQPYSCFDNPSYNVVGSGLGLLKVKEHLDDFDAPRYNLRDIEVSIDEYVEKHISQADIIKNNPEWKIY